MDTRFINWGLTAPLAAQGLPRYYVFPYPDSKEVRLEFPCCMCGDIKFHYTAKDAEDLQNYLKFVTDRNTKEVQEFVCSKAICEHRKSKRDQSVE